MEENERERRRNRGVLCECREIGGNHGSREEGRSGGASLDVDVLSMRPTNPIKNTMGRSSS